VAKRCKSPISVISVIAVTTPTPWITVRVQPSVLEQRRDLGVEFLDPCADAGHVGSGLGESIQLDTVGCTQVWTDVLQPCQPVQ